LPEQISHLVRQVFPDAEVVSSQLFPGEHTNLNYGLRLTNLMTGVVLKVYADVSADVLAHKEVRLLRMLTSETGVPVPRVLHFADAGDMSWSLLTRLPGRPLSEVIDILDGGEQESIGYEMGRYLGFIHQIPLDEFGELFEADALNRVSEKGHILSKVAQYLDICDEDALLSGHGAAKIHALFAQTTFLNYRQARLLHGDYRPENVIVERGTTGYHVTGIIEFAYARGGSPELDMTKLFLWHFEGVPSFEKGFLDGYVESGELGTRFWDRLGLYRIFTCLECVVLARQKGRLELENQHRVRLIESLGLFGDSI
jgi:aminoglycoside phosphotransferase (APT) family kinase protein